MLDGWAWALVKCSLNIVKIFHIVHQYPPDHLGGTELYTQDLARRQATIGHEPVVFVPAADGHSDPEPARESGVRVYRRSIGPGNRQAVFLSTFWNPVAQRALTRTLDCEQPDVLHIQHLMGLPASLLGALQKREIPYVVTLHDYWYFCANAQLLTNYDQTNCAGPDRYLNCAGCFLARGGLPDGSVQRRAVAPLLTRRNSLLKPVLEQAQAIIAPSNFIRDEYIRLGAPAKRMIVVPHGIQAPEEMPPKGRPAAGELNVAYLGGIAWQKGVHVLVEAANEMPAGIKITIYGDLGIHQEYANGLQLQARNPGLTFSGRLEREKVWQVLVAADVIVVPSIWYENSPIIVLEARTAGTPVIASDLGALPEQVVNDQDGLLFPAGNAAALRKLLIELLAHPERLRELRNTIRPATRIEDHVRDIEALYRSVLGDTNSP
jgi:glycosyltransferase involved in cell wall biosynthesis